MVINVVLFVSATENTLPYTMNESEIVEIERSLTTKSFSNNFFQVTSHTYARDIPAIYWVYLEKSHGTFTKVDNWRFGSWVISPEDCIITFKTDIEGRHVVIGHGSSGVLHRSIIYSGVSISFDKVFYIFMGFAVAAICFMCGCSKYQKIRHSSSEVNSNQIYDQEGARAINWKV